jgi:squalene-hopene/tetraprenyl-beta-curcumene cyclase
VRVSAAGSGPAAQQEPLLPPELQARVARACTTAVAGLEAERGSAGHWTGGLSASALSTATAVVALTLVARRDADADRRTAGQVAAGFRWLVKHQNRDGGWGDTVRSKSNLSTTTLVWAALALAPAEADGVSPAAELAGQWIRRAAGSLEPAALVRAIEARYGRDRTFSIPILTLCALCGRLGEGAEAWRWVRQLPFEIAVLPQRWFGALQLPVVSYALPALIAIGQVRHGLLPTGNPVWRALRDRCRAPTLEKLRTLQPPNGGFLEATPLTSFVTMSLAGLGLVEHGVVKQGVAFIEASARSDGSWPIDTNLATWVTTLAVQALGPQRSATKCGGADREARSTLLSWLLDQQHRVIHPYTLAAPGGWAWTDLPGGVPDADDTPGALLALRQLGAADPNALAAAAAGVAWLIDLQNRDGGIPTFCRGWGRLPFDRSSPDLTAHAVRAWIAWRGDLPSVLQERIDRALRRAWKFLQATQRADGAWVPLWFGHQDAPDDENPLYGTARVVPALCDLLAAEVDRASTGLGDVRPLLDRAVAWLVAQQHADGGWSAAAEAESSAEETGVAVEALATAWAGGWVASGHRDVTRQALGRGAAWLCAAVESGRWREPSPIGFYFAKLWYFERLYPMIFTTGALVRLARGAG